MTAKEVKKLVKALEAQGFEVKIGKTNHPKVYRDGKLITTLPSTPSDWRSLKNALALLKRAGFTK